MSRRRANGKHRAKRPATAAERLAKAYVCGDCGATSDRVTVDEYGLNHVHVIHADSCPVLSGAVADIGDVFRAATRAGVAMLAVKVADGGASDE
ncbi:hypothetical protein [Streptomyces sp. MZ04]|uniref:hypothetical protein n=1 Tax=Streptomyces sp. MZ04 TaxID=2559236 RepID=UPI00107E9FF4|nr:hypothetical protein [Streptomyces sp. MZ04]TGB13299.1 hypothetical protein E2651_09810 [Streptomyces sp. MZ04]